MLLFQQDIFACKIWLAINLIHEPKVIEGVSNEWVLSKHNVCNKIHYEAKTLHIAMGFHGNYNIDLWILIEDF